MGEIPIGLDHKRLNIFKPNRSNERQFAKDQSKLQPGWCRHLPASSKERKNPKDLGEKESNSARIALRASWNWGETEFQLDGLWNPGHTERSGERSSWQCRPSS